MKKKRNIGFKVWLGIFAVIFFAIIIFIFLLTKKQSENIEIETNLSQCDGYNAIGKAECYIDLAELYNDSRICDAMITEAGYEFQKDNCYFQVGIRVLDYHICEKIIDIETFGSDCYSSIAAEKKDLSICDQISLSNEKENCYSRVAGSKKDPTICEKIKEGWKKDDCYAGVAIARKDPRLCNKISGIGTCDDVCCYTGIARVKQDPKICDLINDEFLRHYCYQEIGESS